MRSGAPPAPFPPRRTRRRATLTVGAANIRLRDLLVGVASTLCALPLLFGVLGGGNRGAQDVAADQSSTSTSSAASSAPASPSTRSVSQADTSAGSLLDGADPGNLLQAGAGQARARLRGLTEFGLVEVPAAASPTEPSVPEVPATSGSASSESATAATAAPAPPATAAPATAPPATAPPATAPPATATAAGEPTAAQWEALRQCEAWGSYTVVSSNGKYFGAYQFGQGTWDSVARSVGRTDLVGIRPSDASPSDQDALALALWRSSGWSSWPTCSTRAAGA